MMDLAIVLEAYVVMSDADKNVWEAQTYKSERKHQVI
jgi:hypothetical protein